MAYKKSGETRDRLLKAAARIFSERGYYETDIREIAGEAGIGRASFYYYFADKEKVARAVFDSYVDRIMSAADTIIARNTIVALPDHQRTEEALRTFIEYILMFKYIALNRATHAVYYDLVNFADYDVANMNRLKRTTFRDTGKLAALYGRILSDDEITALVITTNAQAKSIFKAILNGVLGFDLVKATDYFFRHALLPDIPIPEPEYRTLLAAAFELCDSVSLD